MEEISGEGRRGGGSIGRGDGRRRDIRRGTGGGSNWRRKRTSLGARGEAEGVGWTKRDEERGQRRSRREWWRRRRSRKKRKK